MIKTKSIANVPYQKVMNKDLIIKELKNRGCRITSQRKLLIDIILENDCSCCKEIHYQALEKDPSVGVATVYRLIKTLEDIGAIDRKNLFLISCDHLTNKRENQVVFIDEESHKMLEMKKDVWYEQLQEVLRSQGLIDNNKISVVIRKINVDS